MSGFILKEIKATDLTEQLLLKEKQTSQPD